MFWRGEKKDGFINSYNVGLWLGDKVFNLY